MLVSIRANSSLPVTIVSNNYPSKEWHLMPDTLVQIKDEDCFTDGRLDPAKAKLSLWKYSDYEETIYLDVDGCLLKELDFEFKYFTTHVNGYLSKDDEVSDINLWVKPDILYRKYGIPETNKLPGTNSSFMAWDKKGIDVFKRALRNYENPVPLDSLTYQWGKSKCQPDELYLNVALAQLGYQPEPLNVLFTRRRNAKGGYVGLTYIQQNFYVLCCWGGLEFNAFEISGSGNIRSGLYNLLMTKNFEKVIGVNTFYDHFYALITKKIYAKGIS